MEYNGGLTDVEETQSLFICKSWNRKTLTDWILKSLFYDIALHYLSSVYLMISAYFILSHENRLLLQCGQLSYVFHGLNLHHVGCYVSLLPFKPSILHNRCLCCRLGQTPWLHIIVLSTTSHCDQSEKASLWSSFMSCHSCTCIYRSLKLSCFRFFLFPQKNLSIFNSYIRIAFIEWPWNISKIIKKLMT